MDNNHNIENCPPTGDAGAENLPSPEGSGVACHASGEEKAPLLPLHNGEVRGEVEALKQWEKNHQNITRCISDHIYTYGRLPTHQEMAARTGMTGEEVGRHLEQFTYHPAYREEIELMRMMSSEVLAMMGHLAARGNINAAKLYAEVLEKDHQKPPAKPAEEGPAGHFRINAVHVPVYLVPFLEPGERDEIEAILKAPAYRPADQVIDDHPSPEVRNCRWKERHHKIIDLIGDYMRNFDRLPSVTELAKETGLSRQTLHKHITEFTYHPVFRRDIEQFRALTNRIVLVVLHKARLGDVKAARLFFKIMRELYPVAQPPSGHNYYLQFNQARLDAATLQQLSPEQRAVIAAHFKKASERCQQKKMAA